MEAFQAWADSPDRPGSSSDNGLSTQESGKVGKHRKVGKTSQT